MRISLEDAIRINPQLNPKLFLPTPKHVWNALHRKPICEWHKFIATEYLMPKVETLILVPCVCKKPYNPPRSELYRRFLEIEKQLSSVHFITVSEPLALEPREYWDFQWNNYNLTYDCPYFPWIEEYGYGFQQEYVQKVNQKLHQVINLFFTRNEGRFNRAIALATPRSNIRSLLRNMPISIYVPNFEPRVVITYSENTDRIYMHPKAWEQFIEILQPQLIKANL